VRLNGLGTVEVRTMDGNYPAEVLAAGALLHAAARKVCREDLSVRPSPETRVLEVRDGELLAPDFGYLGGELSSAVLTGGIESPDVALYVDSVLEFAGDDEERLAALSRERRISGKYPTTESRVLAEYVTAGGKISEEEALKLVTRACDELEAQVRRLLHAEKATGESA
jgi:hypothetical protein